MLVCRQPTGSTINICYPSYADPGEQSKLLVLSSASFFDCSYCFDFSYPLSSAQVSLDCATLDHQINRWKASAAAIRNTNHQENFKCELSFKKVRNFRLIPKDCVILNVQYCFTKVCEMGGIFDKNWFTLGTECAQEPFVEGWKRSTFSLRTHVLFCSQHAQSFIQNSPVLRISWACKSNVAHGQIQQTLRDNMTDIMCHNISEEKLFYFSGSIWFTQSLQLHEKL